MVENPVSHIVSSCELRCFLILQILQVGVHRVDTTSDNHLDADIVFDTVLAALATHTRVLDTSESSRNQ